MSQFTSENEQLMLEPEQQPEEEHEDEPTSEPDNLFCEDYECYSPIHDAESIFLFREKMQAELGDAWWRWDPPCLGTEEEETERKKLASIIDSLFGTDEEDKKMQDGKRSGGGGAGASDEEEEESSMPWKRVRDRKG
jgi:hypothetical protein